MLKQNNRKLLFFSILLTIGIFSNMVSNANASINSGIRVNLSISEPPALNETAELIFSVTTPRNASNISAKIILPEGLELLSGNLSWHGKLAKNQIKSIHAKVKAVKTGNWTIIGAATGGNDYIYLSIFKDEGSISEDPFKPDGIEFSKPAVSMNESGIIYNPSILSIKAVAPEGPAQINDTNLRPIRRLINASSNNFNSKTNNFSESNIIVTSAGTITIKGYIKYLDRYNQTQPAFGVTVEAYDDDLGIGRPLSNNLTNSTGYYEVGPITNDDGPFQGTLDVYIRFLASSTKRQVNDASDNVYDGYSCILSNVSDGDIWFPQNCTGASYYTPPISEEKAWWIYFTLYEGYNYLWNKGYVMDKATARWAEGHDANYQWGDESGTHYHLGGQVHLDGRTGSGIGGGHANDPDVILHEYGHNVMWYFYDNFPTTNCPTPHTWYSNESVNCAWTEGWAGFYPTVVYNDDTFSDTTKLLKNLLL